MAGTHLNPLDIGADVDLAVLGFTAQDMSMETFYQTAISSGAISADDKLVVNGHSLGGSIATKFTLNHPDVVEKAYTFNGAGRGGLTADIQQIFGKEFSSLINDKIINVAADGALSAIEDLGVNPGTPDVELAIGNTHSIKDIIAALRNNQFTPEGADILAKVYLRDNDLPVNSDNIKAIGNTILNGEEITDELIDKLQGNDPDEGGEPIVLPDIPPAYGYTSLYKPSTNPDTTPTDDQGTDPTVLPDIPPAYGYTSLYKPITNPDTTPTDDQGTDPTVKTQSNEEQAGSSDDYGYGVTGTENGGDEASSAVAFPSTDRGVITSGEIDYTTNAPTHTYNIKGYSYTGDRTEPSDHPGSKILDGLNDLSSIAPVKVDTDGNNLISDLEGLLTKQVA